MTLWTKIVHGDSARVSDTEAVHLFGIAFRPEILHLRNAKATVEHVVAAPPSCLQNDSDTPSRIIFGEDFAEVNRTLVSMLALKWLLADDYESFTGTQPEHSRLLKKSFQQLREFFLPRLCSADDISTLLVATAIDDVGKDPGLDEGVGGSHSQVVFGAAQAGLLPALQSISTSNQEDLQSLKIGVKPNISQLVQAETAPASFTGLFTGHGCKRAFDIREMVPN